MNYSDIESYGSVKSVSFDEDVTVRVVEAVVDVDEYGDLLGIELLSTVDLHPALRSRRYAEYGYPFVSVDHDADACHVVVASGRSVEQFVRQAAIAVGSSGDLLGISVDLEK